VIVPELPAEIAELKRQVGRFIEAEVYPIEQRVVERNAIDAAELEELRAKARAAGFSMLNMPVDLGGRDLSMLAQGRSRRSPARRRTGSASRSSTGAPASSSSC